MRGGKQLKLLQNLSLMQKACKANVVCKLCVLNAVELALRLAV